VSERRQRRPATPPGGRYTLHLPGPQALNSWIARYTAVRNACETIPAQPSNRVLQSNVRARVGQRAPDLSGSMIAPLSTLDTVASPGPVTLAGMIIHWTRLYEHLLLSRWATCKHHHAAHLRHDFRTARFQLALQLDMQLNVPLGISRESLRNDGPSWPFFLIMGASVLLILMHCHHVYESCPKPCFLF
jgi:hypothetical protein